MSATPADLWIPPHVEMPDADTTVLVQLEDADEPVWLGYFDGDQWRAVEGERLTVLYWQHLPEPRTP